LHHGNSINDACLDALNLSVTEGAKVVGVARHTLSRVINGQAGISPEMAIRLENAGWSKNQAEYDATIWTKGDAESEKRFEAKLKRQAQQLRYINSCQLKKGRLHKRLKPKVQGRSS